MENNISNERFELPRRQFLHTLTRLGGMLALPSISAKAIPPTSKTYRIYAVTWRGKTQVEKGFEDYLGSRGINAEITWRDAAQNAARLAEFVREIKSMAQVARPDLIYTWGTPATLGVAGAYDASSSLLMVNDVAIVFAAVASPVAAKIVPALSNQGRDITGVYHVAALDAQIQAMRTYRQFTKLGVIYNAAEANSVATVDGLRRLGSNQVADQKFEVIATAFDRDAGLGSASQALATNIEEKIFALKRAGAEWLYLGPDSFVFMQIERIAAAALAQRLPTFSATESILNSAAPVLAGLVSSYYAVGQFAAFKAEQILTQGKRARDIPIETLSRYAYNVRIEVAKQLDILPPVSLFNYATIR